MDVSVVIVSYNSRAVLEPCLDSLKRSFDAHRIEVVIVDNASADGTPDWLRERYPWVRLLARHENLGFSRGVNIGIGESRGRHLLILNPDTVLRDGAMEEMVRFMDETPDAGIVGPKLIFHDGNLQYSCRRFYNWRVLLLRRTFLGKVFKDSKAVRDHLMLDFDHESTRAVDWLLGACLLVRREAIESVGLMDERFFLYFEDVDWCYRMQQHGWKVYYHPDAVVVHNYARDSAQSVINRSVVAHLSSLIRYYEKWNAVLYFIKKYREVLKILLFLSVDVIAFILAFFSAYYLRINLGAIFSNPIYPIATYERFVVFELLLFVFTFFAAGLYRIRRETTSVDELFNLARAIVVASVLLMASTYISQIRTYSRMIVAFLVPFATIYTFLGRYAIRRLHRALLEQKLDLKRVCIVGPQDGAGEVRKQLENDPSLGIEVVGVVDPGSGTANGIGRFNELADVVDRYRVQEIIVLPGALSEDHLAEVVVMGRRRVVDVTVITDYSGLVIHQATMTRFAGRPAIAYRRDTRYVVDRVAKRLLDVVLGLLFVVVSLPASVLYSLYAVARGRAPFHWEERLGQRGIPFRIPIAGDRSSSGPSDIVNLPLFWLVIIGKMSMVGPYPLPVALRDLVRGGADFRFSVRPGVTGYWRVGPEQSNPIDQLVAQDASYTQNWSFVEDLKILVLTLGDVIMGRKRSLDINTDRP